MMNLNFYSLTVLDFFEESKNWKEEEFIYNCQIHKQELENVRILRKHNKFYGCKLEIEHLIDFLKKIIWFNGNPKYPGGMKRDDYGLMIEIFRRHNPNLDWNNQ